MYINKERNIYTLYSTLYRRLLPPASTPRVSKFIRNPSQIIRGPCLVERVHLEGHKLPLTAELPQYNSFLKF